MGIEMREMMEIKWETKSEGDVDGKELYKEENKFIIQYVLPYPN